MKKISGVFVVKNEDQYLGYSIMSVYKHLSEIIVVDNGSTDKTSNLLNHLVENFDPGKKIKVLWYAPEDMLDMGKIRTWAINQISKEADWFMVIDGDEIYAEESMLKVVDAVEKAEEKVLAFMVPYYQACLNGTFKESDFVHYPDKIFRAGCGWHFDGLLPVDMMKVGEGFYTYRPFLAYDNKEDTDQPNPRQPKIEGAYFYHYARAKTYARELDKWTTYCRNIHFRDTGVKISDEVARQKASGVKWVNNSYSYERLVEQPEVLKLPLGGFYSHQPLVSVIITNYNYTDWMREAIESVVASSYNNIEIIVVDDGSPDPSFRVTKDFPQVKLIEKHNTGPADSLNVGVRASVGDYYISLDADDMLHPTFITRAVAEAKKDLTKMVFYGDLQTFGEQNNVWSYGHFDINDVVLVDKHTDPVPQSAMIDRRAFNVVGGYDTKPNFFYDWMMFAMIYKKLGANVFKYMEGLHYYYRRHGISNITKIESQRPANEEYMKAQLELIKQL